jgi:hypothetical protein
MGVEYIKLGLTLLNMVISAAVWIFVWQDRKSRVTKNSIESLEQSVQKRFDQKCTRLSKLEAEFKGLPTSHEIIRIHERIDVVNKGNQQTQLMIGELIGQVKQMNEDRKHGSR